ncbi:MAG TPA: ATP-binding protein [Anaerovoracaceae bacterium]|nr:ATP-binding protein [Anaerovoracaceae bacterium]
MKKAIELKKPRWLLAHDHVVFARKLLKDLGFDDQSKRSALKLANKATSVDDLRVIDMYDDAIQNEISLIERQGNWVQKYTSDALEQAINLKITPKALVYYAADEIQEKAVVVVEVPAGKDVPYAFQNEIYIKEGEQTVRADVDTIRDLVMKRQIEPERWERRFSGAEIESDLSGIRT